MEGIEETEEEDSHSLGNKTCTVPRERDRQNGDGLGWATVMPSIKGDERRAWAKERYIVSQ